MGEEMFRLKDRKGADMVLGMTHEEIFATLAAELSSYRELPQFWYQFQLKFRDEPRPKSGLLRVREFTMKDSYSFDVDEAGLDVSFEAHRGAYERIFARLGIPAIAGRGVQREHGRQRLDRVHVPVGGGRGLVARCPDCGYAANLEKATSALPPVADAAGPGRAAAAAHARRAHDRRPGHAARHRGRPADQDARAGHRRAAHAGAAARRSSAGRPEADRRDRRGDIRPAQPEEITAALGASPGSLGAVGVTDLPVIADLALRGRRDMTTGANIDDVHLTGVTSTATSPSAGGRTCARSRRASPARGAATPLEIVRRSRSGTSSSSGRKYTTALGVTVLGPDGSSIVPIMGSYGIGVERAMAAIAEVHHDDNGLAWPVAVAPAEVDRRRCCTSKDEAARAAAETSTPGCRPAAWTRLIDDRDERPGVKFRDAELTGIPCRVSVGSRDLADGMVEVALRATGEKSGCRWSRPSGTCSSTWPTSAPPKLQAAPDLAVRALPTRGWVSVSARVEDSAKGPVATRSLWLASALQSWLLLGIGTLPRVSHLVATLAAARMPCRHIRHVWGTHSATSQR